MLWTGSSTSDWLMCLLFLLTLSKRMSMIILVIVLLLLVAGGVGLYFFLKRQPKIVACPADTIYGTTTVGSIAYAECGSGYTGRKSAVCQADGTFATTDSSACRSSTTAITTPSTNLIAPVPIVTPAPTVTPTTAVVSTCPQSYLFPATAVNGKATAVCGTGYTGNRVAMCRADGTFSPADESGCVRVITGRYIRLRQPAVGCFNVGEVKVMSAGQNVALGKSVTLSSTTQDNGYPGSFLVDGKFDTFAHTSCGDAGVMTIDLGSQYPIDSIVVYNRAECCSGRMLGGVIEILASTSPDLVAWKSDPFADKTGKTTYQATGSTGITTYTATLPSPTLTAL